MMATARRSIPPSVRDEVLREAGYMCGNPRCRYVLTLELHHIVWVKDKGGNNALNLIALCPNCHALHTKGEIPDSAIRHWKGLLHALNHAFSREAMDLLLFLHALGSKQVWYSGDGLLRFASLIAAELAEVCAHAGDDGESEPDSALFSDILGVLRDVTYVRVPSTAVRVQLTSKGRGLVDAWLAGDEDGYRRALHAKQRKR